VVVSIFAAISTPAYASLTSFQTFVGSVGYSSDGCGTTSTSCTLSAQVPVGATVLAAYLYTSAVQNGIGGRGGTLNGSAVSYSALLGANNANLQAARADVTSIVTAAVGGGSAVPINFLVTETNSSSIDGEALIVVYNLPSLATSTVGILDGFSATTGDTSSINFATPLNPAAPGFVAEMIIGDGFSCCGPSSLQVSRITVNGTLITQNAGNNDDNKDSLDSDGNLITVGSNFEDPFSPLLPTYLQDHERYNLIPQIAAGSTTISVATLNPSNDDNIFLELFYVSGSGSVNTPPPPVPEPSSMLLLGAGLIGLAGLGYRKFRVQVQKN